MNLEVLQYKWAGSWGPFHIKVPCGECSVTETMIRKVIETEFQGYEIAFQVRDWLPNWWRVILRGGWHAPIVMVNDKLIGQGRVIDPGTLAAALRAEIARQSHIHPGENIIFGKESCPFCRRAKEILEKEEIDFRYRDILDDPTAMMTMFALVKKIIPSNKPITVPQIWLDGKYIGGCDDLEKMISGKQEKTGEHCTGGVCQV